MKENESLTAVIMGTAETLDAPKKVLSQEERKRLDRFFVEIGDGHVAKFFPSDREVSLSKKLKKEGTLAAIYILEKIADIQEYNEDRVLFNNIKNLKICATKEVAAEIGVLLLEDKITGDPDGSNKSNLINILEEVGTSKEAHFLSESVHKIFNRERQIRGDSEDAFFCLEKILERTENHNERVDIEKAMDEINSFREEKGWEKIQSVLSHAENHGNFFETQEDNQFFDKNEEKIFEDEYSEKGRMISAVDRLEIVKNLRLAAKKEADTSDTIEYPDNFLEKQFLEYKEKNPSKYGVTLGIEIEIPTKSLFPKGLKKKIGEDAYYEKYDKMEEQFKESKQLGVPEGGDGNTFWEFAHEPARNPLTISREVQALIGMGLINKNYTKFPLHNNIGGITSKTEKGNQAHVLSHALEATAWSTDEYRIMRPYNTKSGSWSQKGKGSLHERGEKFNYSTNSEAMKSSSEQGIGKFGVEFRALQLQSLTGLDRHLRSAFYLGTALRAFQEKKENDEKDIVVVELADIWEKFSNECSRIFKSVNLTDPKEVWEINEWESESIEPFVELANLLKEGTTVKGSQAANFIHDIRLLIIQTRRRVKEVLEKEELIK